MRVPWAIRRRFAFGVRGRLTIWFVLVAVGAVVFGGGVVYYTGLASIQSTLGQTYCQIAARVARQFESKIAVENRFVGNIATDVLTTEVAVEAGAIYGRRPRQWVDARLARLAREWRETKASERGKVLHPQLSRRLAILAGLRDVPLVHIAVFDHLGLLIAASTPAAERVQGDSDWFRALRSQSGHSVYFEYDKGTRTFSMVAPIWAGVDVVGYVLGEYEDSAFLDFIDNVRFGETGEALLVDYAGVPLRGAPRSALIQALAIKPLGGARSGSDEPHWITASTEGNWPFWRRLVCVASSHEINQRRSQFGRPPWSVVVTQAPSESYAALRRSLGYFAFVGLIGAGVAGGGGAFMAWRIAAPITRLRTGVRRFAEGDRDSLTGILGKDEIGELADEFNRMAQRIRASETELRAFAQAVEDAGDAIIMTDSAGVIRYANSAFERITGYAAEEARGQDLSLLRGRKTSTEASGALYAAFATGEAWRGDIWSRRKTGEEYPADVTVSPIQDEAGSLTAFIAIHRDITLAHEHQERLEREVEARTREIRETEGLAVMGRMASMIAHDLRNALSTVKMNLQMLLRRHSSAQQVENEQCCMGLEQVRYMEEILREMLVYARPEKMQRDWYDLPHIIDEALAAFSNACVERDVAVVHQKDARLPKISCDRVKLLQILRNLIQNAIGAMPGGGTLRLTAHMTLDDPDSGFVIVVEDTGDGIPADVLPDVFEPFFTTRARGSGLGLAIVKRLVGQHGGAIRIDSEPGVGTIATLILPTGLQQSEYPHGSHAYH
ncbi:MAG: ATP-binding protein [Methyloligellaceae bacterium]